MEIIGAIGGARIQSPSYPSMPLRDAVTAIKKIEEKYRSSTVDRADAAKLLGYAGLTGPSNMALAALAAYGLTDRAGKGEIRVTERARTILYPDNESERRSALAEAAMNPPLYQDLRERYPDVPIPPEDGVITYLNRKGFNPAAVKPAARAFLQTMHYLQETGALESNGPPPSDERPSPRLDRIEEPKAMQSASHAEVVRVSPRPFPVEAIDLPLNEPNLNIRGGTVHVEALLDFDGLSELEDQIKALKMILKPKRAAATPASGNANNDDL